MFALKKTCQPHDLVTVAACCNENISVGGWIYGPNSIIFSQTVTDKPQKEACSGYYGSQPAYAPREPTAGHLMPSCSRTPSA
ncbi:hypothetical protein PFLUV_G00115460 [Perca fluviatilis]|uniref:Uncharacterized protein n=1 Tax=Perca fluviatilis TaxID=8168 RepID=A0A6A5F3S1_PERFL|nr:hypothetical protein PFLUV_G00115460 [Perca fluviatilis]